MPNRKFSFITFFMIAAYICGALAFGKDTGGVTLRFTKADAHPWTIVIPFYGRAIFTPKARMQLLSRVSGVVSGLAYGYNSIVPKGRILMKITPKQGPAQIIRSGGGYVEKMEVANGESVKAGLVMLVQYSPKYFQITVPIFPENISELWKKTPVEAETVSAPHHKVKAVITGGTGAISENTQMCSITITIYNTHGWLKPGDWIKSRILEPSDSVDVIPNSAIVKEHGDEYVYVKTGGKDWSLKKTKVVVEPYAHGIKYSLAPSPLNMGDEVLVNPSALKSYKGPHQVISGE